MKIDYVSDLHINHHIPFKANQKKWEQQTKEWAKKLLKTKGGEVLVVAGDFSEWNRQTIWFLEEVSLYYNHVFFVTGNHDYYLISRSRRKKYADSKARQRNLIEKAAKIRNVTPLCREVVNYKGKVIAGDSLWYNLVKQEDWYFFFQCSNDANYIFVNDAYTFDRNTRHDEMMYLYEEAITWYYSLENKQIDLMISHIPPLHPPISPHKRNACYDVPVPFLVSNKWICGHQHLQGKFEKASTLFYMNAIGYPDENNNLTLKTLEI